ncbi:MAG: VWA domain-containing protein [Planctomycetota bacterium]
MRPSASPSAAPVGRPRPENRTPRVLSIRSTGTRRGVPRLLACVAACLLGTLALAPAAHSRTAATQASFEPDTIERRLLRWRREVERGTSPNQSYVVRLQRALATHVGSSPGDTAVWRALLVAATLDGTSDEPFGSVRRPGNATFESLAGWSREQLGALLTSEHASSMSTWALGRVVAAMPSGRRRDSFPTIVDRRAVLRALWQSGNERMRVPLLAVGRRGDDPLRPDALRVLAAWSMRHGADEAIDLFLVELLGRKFDRATRPHPYTVLLQRLGEGNTPLQPRARAKLSERVGLMLLANDWRDAARALRLSAGFPLEERVPILLDALNVWHARSQSGREVPGLVRVQGDIVRALRELSDQHHGPYPGPWIDWWVRVRQGESPMPGSPEFLAARARRAEQGGSVAPGFFGIRPETDRFTFVLDLSGSMKQNYGTTERTRYLEAVDQLVRFLQAAPKGSEFNVVLFGTGAVALSDEPIPLDAESLADTRDELIRIQPLGATQLRPGIETALRLDDDGLPVLDGATPDTVIVLCDGATEEGPAWVGPMLERVLPIHPVQFHCVLLGHRGDGALRRLAESSGGKLVRVGA